MVEAQPRQLGPGAGRTSLGAAGEAGPDGVDLFWIPLGAGAGGTVVRWSGRVYEAVAAARARRPRQGLFHSALEVTVDGHRTAIEMAPVWTTTGDRGVVAEGPVGRRFLGRWRPFRYEIRCWRDGTIPDIAAAQDAPIRMSDRPEAARTILGLVPEFPACTWGRDELGTGDMWSSNSLVSWLLAGAGLRVDDVGPPLAGRAPGWDAGLAAASRRAGVRVVAASTVSATPGPIGPGVAGSETTSTGDERF
jgi:hypothetical protein